MERIEIMRKFMDGIKKYRYVILVLVIGIVLMLLPDGQETVVQEAKNTDPIDTQTSVSEQLEQVLSQIEGVGKVQVMLALSAGEETVYQTDTEESASGESSSIQVETVLITDSEKNQTGLIRQINPERYMGAIIVCQGADDASVRLAVMQAVANVTGLGTDKISVLKMK